MCHTLSKKLKKPPGLVSRAIGATQLFKVPNWWLVPPPELGNPYENDDSPKSLVLEEREKRLLTCKTQTPRTGNARQ